jgi:hypothetical protein
MESTCKSLHRPDRAFNVLFKFGGTWAIRKMTGVVIGLPLGSAGAFGTWTKQSAARSFDHQRPTRQRRPSRHPSPGAALVPALTVVGPHTWGASAI